MEGIPAQGERPLRAAEGGGGETHGPSMASVAVGMHAIAMLNFCRSTLATGDGGSATAVVLCHGEEDDVVGIGVSWGSRSRTTGAGRRCCCGRINALWAYGCSLRRSATLRSPLLPASWPPAIPALGSLRL
jgi:hypothetical protein